MRSVSRELAVEDMNLNRQIAWSDVDRIVSNDMRYVAFGHETTYGYDALGRFEGCSDDGNQTRFATKTGAWRVTYNGEDRPVRWVRESDNATITMSYDHMGRRRAKNGQRFFYDGYLQIADDAGNAYMWDPTEPIATRPLAWLRPSSDATASQSQNNSNPPLSNSNSELQLLLYVHDGNKNVSEVIATNGAVLALGGDPFEGAQENACVREDCCCE